MALIAMAVYDTKENKRTEYTKRTLISLCDTVDFKNHHVIIVDNNSCQETKDLLSYYSVHSGIRTITLPENVGTAKAVNKAWQFRKAGEHCVKMDNDVVIHYDRWLDEMEQAIERDSNIGIVGLKRKDCWENPHHAIGFYRSQLSMLPQVAGERWIVVERVNHVMGTCQMFNSDLLDKIGYLYQPRLYGFDDALAAIRCQVAGFYSCFLPHIEIDHIDTGATAYQGWKEKHAGEDMAEYHRLKEAYTTGQRPIFEQP